MLDINKNKKFYPKGRNTEESAVKEIKDLIEKYNFNEFELLYIDTEGYDGNIIIDFLETCFIKPFLIFEYIHIEHDTFKKTLKILKEKDYSYFKVDENLLCFSHKKSFF